MNLMAGLNMMGGKNGLQDGAQGFMQGLLQAGEYQKLARQEKRQNQAYDLQMLQYQRQLENDQRQSDLNALNMQLKQRELDQPSAKGVPTGFTLDDSSALVPRPVNGYGNYADYQLKLAEGRNNLVSPMELAKYKLSVDANNRADAAASRTASNDAQRLDMERQRFNLQQQQFEASRLRDIPNAQIAAGMDEVSALQKIDNARTLIQSNPGALGAQNALPDFIIQRADPNGVDVRSAIADIASQKFHDLSGAAVTASEAARLKPYLPSVTDTPEAAQKKLEALRKEYQNIYDQRRQQFSNGYRGSLPEYTPSAASSPQTTLEVGDEAALRRDLQQMSPNHPDRRAIEAELARRKRQSMQAPRIEATKVIRGKTYVKINGEWHEQ
jgi:hypothetical protein